MTGNFYETIQNVLNNYLPHKTVNFHDQDPSWIINEIQKTYAGVMFILSRA